MKLPKKSFLIFAVVTSLTWGSPAAEEYLSESPDGPEHVIVYLELEEALAKVFPGAEKIWTEEWIPSPDEKQSLEFSLGWHLNQESFIFYRAEKKGTDLGYAVVDQQVGRFKPITFMVQISPKGEVGRIEVMVYRESRGEGIKRQRFLKQFRGKSLGDPIRMNRDITVLSGATMSSRALTAGVRKVLALVQRRYLDD
jgi:FAD:protein FMN transferase